MTSLNHHQNSRTFQPWVPRRGLEFKDFTLHQGRGNQGWHIGLPIYRHFLKYRLSVSVKARIDKISAIGYRLWTNIGFEYWLYFSDFYPIYR